MARIHDDIKDQDDCWDIPDDIGEEDICDGCGEVEGQCPLCCGFIYSPGSEECDFCGYERECATLTRRALKRTANR